MCHCITPQALLQGLVRRVETGYEPTTSDLRAVVSGCGAAEVRAMVAQMTGAGAERLGLALERAFPTERYQRG